MHCFAMVLSRSLGLSFWPQTLHPKFMKYGTMCIFRELCCSSRGWYVFFWSSHQAPLHLQRVRCCRMDQRSSSRKSNVAFVLLKVPALCGVKNSQCMSASTWNQSIYSEWQVKAVILGIGWRWKWLNVCKIISIMILNHCRMFTFIPSKRCIC